MLRRWRTMALVTVLLLTLTLAMLPTAGIAADSDAGVSGSDTVGAQLALPECGPARDGEVREYFGALWQCTYINGHWKWIAIGCSGCVIAGDVTVVPRDR